ncbi:dihydrolipoyl dehydrogenase family protein [Lacticaseibacillus jixiensis]|uniref:dihydrolipoyl dehydrogenase family protein n=1 Tax=Lacticaseibacillus jixiensis TaxID=3231926 RepID=UPI0036F3D356
MNEYDVIIIGAGPAGMAAANVLASHQRALMFEGDLWGGTCPNRGCDPKKMLYRAAEVKAAAASMAQVGIISETAIAWPKLMHFKRSYTDTVPEKTLASLNALGVVTRHARPHFVDAHTVQAEDVTYTAKNIIIATGRVPAKPDIPGAELLQTSTEFLNLSQLPQSIAFIGAGYVAVELANIAALAGSTVHIINRSKRLLRGWDRDATETLRQLMIQRRVRWHDEVSLTAVRPAVNGVRLLGEEGFELVVNTAFSAIGRVPAMDLGLDKIGLLPTSDGLRVDAHMQTDVPHVYAIGDVVDKMEPKLTPVASFEGRYVGRHLLGVSDPIQYPAIPEIIFGATELAHVGVRLDAAKAQPERYLVRDQDVSHWYTYNRVQDETARVVTITDRESGDLVGALIVSAHAEELVNQFALLIDSHTSNMARELIYGYPSVSSDLQYLLRTPRS